MGEENIKPRMVGNNFGMVLGARLDLSAMTPLDMLAKSANDTRAMLGLEPLTREQIVAIAEEASDKEDFKRRVLR